MRIAMLCLAAVVTIFASCGGSDDASLEGQGTGGSDASAGGNGGSGPGCIAHGKACNDSASCCSKQCDPGSLTCTSTVGRCVQPAGACAASTDCCSLACVNNVCNVDACLSDGKPCADPAQCCGGSCAGGTCQPLNTACKTAGNSCDGNDGCCSKLCTNGTCTLGSSFCIQTGDVCAVASDCCGGICTVAQGAALGTCGAPPAGASFCHGGFDGTVCQTCNDCCSRLCVPWGEAGVNVCQRASGCHIDGDLCRKDADCCGAPGTGLPGEGNGSCEVQQGQQVGICRNPKGCNPEGNVCHYKNYACDISSARNDCCGDPGNSGACQLDTLGVPRCHSITECRKEGETCTNASDCCDAVPCVPDSNGLLRCATHETDGGTTCIPSGGSCTINADCCPGVECYVPTGSTQGTCGVPGPDAGVDGSVPEAGTPDSGPTCSLYGQACTTSGDCCNSVPCTSPTLITCTGSEAGCKCFVPIK